MNVLHDPKWTRKAYLATLVASLAFVCAFGINRAEAKPPPEMWDCVGVWLHEPSGGLLEFREDGTYEMTLLNPITGRTLVRDEGSYEVIEGVIVAESNSGSTARIYVIGMGPPVLTFRFTRDGIDVAELTCVRLRH